LTDENTIEARFYFIKKIEARFYSVAHQSHKIKARFYLGRLKINFQESRKAEKKVGRYEGNKEGRGKETFEERKEGRKVA
jgi:hypothetical protein